MTAPTFVSPLPPRPLPLDRTLLRERRRGLVLSLVGHGVLLLLALVLVAWQLASRWSVDTLWARGNPGVLVAHEVKQNAPEGFEFLSAMPAYEVHVTFEDASGGLHRGTREFFYVFASLPGGARPEVRYEPSHPERFVLSWEAVGFKPWSSLVFMLVCAGLLGGIVLWRMRALGMLLALPRLCAKDGREVLLELVSVVELEEQVLVVYRLPGEGPGRERRVLLDGAPYRMKVEGKAWLLALESPRAPGRYLILEETLLPFALAAVEGQTALVLAPAEE
ncbi:hypothetical protein NR798_38405 [Archangium gephyra]|uniref:DUF3592 domain-containing protein n=1 Tax=Archangium gephyra TaxID=48 RepID=UPI0035D41A66